MLVISPLGQIIGVNLLYKYIKKEHLGLFLKNGTIKIGTLLEYRNEKDLGSVIGDNQEGLHITELNSPNGREIDLASNTPEAEYFRKNVLRPDQQNSNVKIVMEAGANIIVHTNSPTYYVYCVTSTYDKNVMREFACDRCIEIINPEKFFKEVNRVMRHKADFEGCFDVVYGNKTTDHLNPHKVHPALMKEAKYNNQAEVRAIWRPKKEPKSSLFVKVPKAIKYCREFKP